MPGNYLVATQLVTSQIALSSTESVSPDIINYKHVDAEQGIRLSYLSDMAGRFVFLFTLGTGIQAAGFKEKREPEVAFRACSR
jgi:hypothetical protein